MSRKKKGEFGYDGKACAGHCRRRTFYDPLGKIYTAIGVASIATQSVARLDDAKRRSVYALLWQAERPRGRR